MKPWIHFVPIKSDLSDLREKLTYLRNNDHIGEEIAFNSEEFFSKKSYSNWEDLSIESLNESLKNYPDIGI